MDGTAAELCADQLRRFDRGRFLATLFAPRHARSALWAVYAFALEIARARDQREEIAREIRLQWWRDAVESIYAGRTPETPTVRALAEAIAAHELARDKLEALIEAETGGVAVHARRLALDVLGVSEGRRAFAALAEPRGGPVTMPLRLVWDYWRGRVR